MDGIWKILAIGIGGSLGAVARHLLNISPLAGLFPRFPLPTLVINVAGSFLIGFLIIVLADKYVVSDVMRAAVIVGFLGAFTTFSTFEMEIYALLRDRELSTGFLYLFLSVFLGFAALAGGVALGRRL